MLASGKAIFYAKLSFYIFFFQMEKEMRELEEIAAFGGMAQRS